jgi:hypothetical protein
LTGDQEKINSQGSRFMVKNTQNGSTLNGEAGKGTIE